MADNGFRTFRRDPPAHDDEPLSHEGPSDPLAELARIIGQSDPHGGRSREDRQPESFDDRAPAAGTDWASSDDGYADESYQPEPSYAKPGYAKSAENYRSPAADPHSWPQDREYEDDPLPAAPPRTIAPPPLPFGDSREDARGYGGGMPDSLQGVRPRDDLHPAGSRSQPGSKFPAASEAAYAEDYPEEEYAEEAPPVRRSGTIIIVALLGLAVFGTAGALGYRAMFGHSVLPSLPPIIRPGEGPIKIVPGHQAQGAPAASDPNKAGPGEHVVGRQEQPVELPPAVRTPRVITTIPVVPNSPDSLPEAAQTPAPPIANTPPPSAPGAAPAPAFGAPNQLGAPATAPQPGSREVHTVIVRPEEAPGAANPPPPPPVSSPARVPAARPARTREPAPRAHRTPRETAAAGPMSIVPNQSGEIRQPARTHTALVHSGNPAPTSLRSRPVSAPSGGGFAVQVSSQRSEAEAEAAFRALQARFPHQLGGRHAIVRRADLGAKGVYYRAMIPFASGEQASGLCNSLRAAGGNCIIQRN
jgi:hypothetical protein